MIVSNINCPHCLLEKIYHDELYQALNTAQFAIIATINI